MASKGEGPLALEGVLGADGAARPGLKRYAAASFNARSWYIPPSDFLARLEATPAAKRDVVTGTYVQGLTNHAFWLKITRWAYNLGILFLLAGLAFVLLPEGDISTGRYVVIGLTAAGFLAELIWLFAGDPRKAKPATAANAAKQPPSAPKPPAEG